MSACDGVAAVRAPMGAEQRSSPAAASESTAGDDDLSSLDR